MEKPLYANANWSLLVTDLETGDTFYQLNPDKLSFTGSTRKIFSVGLALDALAGDIKASGVDSVSGDIAVDSRFFEAYRVPNGDLLITPMMLNENQIDVSIMPTQTGQAGNLSYRPETSLFSVLNQTSTSVMETIKFSGNRLTSGVGDEGIVEGEFLRM